ncbi:MAG: hypothetical protein MUE48_02135 [Desulfobacterales bacterium]|jgi:hypothetical protein|nr:hypothetical protein [Desulfobacterales bacterium]
MRTCVIVVGIAVLMVACAAPPKAPEGPKLTAEQIDPGPFPEDYELRIISWLRMNAPDPDAVRVVSVQPPQPVALEAALPDIGLEKGETVWESIAYTQSTGSAAPPVMRRFHFKDGVIRAVYTK